MTARIRATENGTTLREGIAVSYDTLGYTRYPLEAGNTPALSGNGLSLSKQTRTPAREAPVEGAPVGISD